MKRGIAGILVFCLTFGVLGNSALAAEVAEPEEELDYVLGREMTEEEERQQLEMFDRYVGQNNYIEMEGPELDIRVNAGANSMECVSLPSAYDSRNVNGVCCITPIRNQNPYGTCWAFSAIACIEANLIKKGYADTDIDLSERHLVYFSNHSVPDELGNSGRDESYYAGTSNIYDRGGNTWLAYRALAAWRGAVTEEFCPYTGIPTEPDTAAAGVYDNDYAHLTGYYRIAYEDVTTIKRAIMEYGAVSGSYYADSFFLNASTAAYYCNVSCGQNHGIAIVGWDDSYRKENFKNQPSSDGAWLVKNSWGTYFGNQGYFWLSYEDQSISDEMCAYEAELANNDDNNYQYDTVTGGMRINSTAGKGFASVFTAKGAPGKLEKLSAVSIEISSPANVNYSLQIYKDVQDPSDPTSGEAVLSTPQTGVLDMAGYHTIQVNETVLLDQGSLFSAVLNLTCDGSDYVWVGVETDCDGEFYSNATAESGQNFVSYDRNYWFDYGMQQDANLRMKVFTKKTDTNPISCSGVKISQDSAQLYEGESIQLSATVLPENASNKTCSWKSSNEKVVTVSRTGLVKAIGEGVATVEVATLDGNYTASCQITVKKLVYAESVAISPKWIKLAPGQKTQLSASILPQNVSNSGVEWVSWNEDIATVDQSGRVTAIKDGEAVIMAIAKDGSGVSDNSVVVVAKDVESIKLSASTLDMKVGDVQTLTAAVSPDDASNKGIQWYSSDERVATVNSFGKVTASRRGTARIVASAQDGSGVSESCVVNVTQPVRSIVLSYHIMTMDVGEKQTLDAQVAPSDANNQSLKWSSSDTNVATVDQEGKITALKKGTVTITAAAQDGSGVKGTCAVTVIQQQVATPTITRFGDLLVINTTTPGATIYYTTDGSTPTVTNGNKVDDFYAMVDTFSGHLKAIAVKEGYINSDMAKLTLFSATAKRNVSFGVKGVFGGRNVTFHSDLEGAKIYYSSTTSTLTTSDKCVNVGETVLFEDFYGTIYARTYKDGQWGNVCRLILKIPVVNTPTISIDNRGYASIRTTTPKCYLYYTTDGSTPSMTNGKKINASYGKVYVGKGKTVKAIAVRSCFTHSAVASNKNGN